MLGEWLGGGYNPSLVSQSKSSVTVHNSANPLRSAVGGGVGFGGGRSTLLQSESDISVTTSTGPNNHISNWCTGAGAGCSNRFSLSQTDVNAKVSASGAFGSAGIGVGEGFQTSVTQKGVNGSVKTTGWVAHAGGGFGSAIGWDNSLSQTAVNFEIGRASSGYGSAFGYLGAASRIDIRLWLYSGDARGIPVCGAIDGYAWISGFADTAAYNADATTCLGTAGGFQILNSTGGDDWRTIHETLCKPDVKRDTSCHSPHEQLLTMASGGEDSVYLVSEQRYPYRKTSDNLGLVRIVRLQREGNGSGNSTTLVHDNTFGEHGSVLLNASTNQENRTLLRGLPVSQRVSDTHLTSLYALPPSFTNTSSNASSSKNTVQTGVALVRFPLTEGNTVEIETYPQLPGRPYFLEQNETSERVWMWEQTSGQNPVNRLTRNQLIDGSFIEEQIFDLNMTEFPDHKIIAVNKDNEYVYVARRNDSDLTLEGYELTTGELDNWEKSVNLLSGTEDGQYALSISTHQVNSGYSQKRFDFYPLETALVPGSDNATGLRVLVPEYGGEAELTFFTPERIVADRFATPDPSTIIGGAVAGGVALTGAVAGTIAGAAYKCKDKMKKRERKKREALNARYRKRPGWKKDQEAAQQEKFEMQQG